uniref:Thymus, brain and testes associated n=1 Tax=Sander lucioperca TaxID=283035 RepID=A0A8C9XRJ3_SANLU
MSMAQSSDSRGTTGDSSHCQTNQVPFTPEFTKMLTKSSPRFGALSHHSFFSRHNPHPHRVKHIQVVTKTNQVCLESHTAPTFSHKKLCLQRIELSFRIMGVIYSLYFTAQFSEAWRDELKDLAAKVSLSCQAQKGKKEDQPEEEFVRRKTQYSAETGRIVPPSSNSYQRRSHSQRLMYPQSFHDQELMVFELLCQILQTDSLSTVQQWLLLAGQRGKNFLCTVAELISIYTNKLKTHIK